MGVINHPITTQMEYVMKKLLLASAILAILGGCGNQANIKTASKLKEEANVNRWVKNCSHDMVEKTNTCDFHYMMDYSTGNGEYDYKIVALIYSPNTQSIMITGDLEPRIAGAIRIDDNQPISMEKFSIDSDVITLNDKQKQQFLTGNILYLKYYPFKESKEEKIVSLANLRRLISEK